MEWFADLLVNFSTIGWFGWYEKVITKWGDGWNNLAFAAFIFLCLSTTLNIFYLLFYKWIDLKISNPFLLFFPFTLGYLIINVVIQFLILCLFLSIGGPLGLLIMGILWGIILLLDWYHDEENNKHLGGIFGLRLQIIGYPERYDKVQKYEKKLQTKYDSFLNMKYE